MPNFDPEQYIVSLYEDIDEDGPIDPIELTIAQGAYDLRLTHLIHTLNDMIGVAKKAGKFERKVDLAVARDILMEIQREEA